MAKSWEVWGSGSYDEMYDYMYNNNINGFKDNMDGTQAGQNYGKTNINDALTNDYNPSFLDKFYTEMTRIKTKQDRFAENYIKPVYNNLTYGLIALACGFVYYKLFYKKGGK